MAIFDFLHTFHPYPIAFSLGPINIYWYGVFMVLGMVSGISLACYLGKYYDLRTELILDLSFWLIVYGLVGARLYHIGLEWGYYRNAPMDIFKIWQGGLAIHGAIIADLLALIGFAWSKKISFWLLASVATPALAIGQVFGRWGNYFNQELFGLPTGLSWGIPIAENLRPAAYLDSQYFHPTFIYESLFCLLLAGALILVHGFVRRVKNPQHSVIRYEAIALSYLIFYSFWRYLLEEVKIDEVPVIGPWRLPQLASLIIAIASLGLFVYSVIKYRQQLKKAAFLEEVVSPGVPVAKVLADKK